MLKVLIVEDEEMIRQGIVLTVDWAALDCVVVAEAANGVEALAAVDQWHPGLIITDLKMPQMDGIQLLTRLREQGNEAYVIILTAYDDFSYVQSALRLGAVDYLLKPFHDGDLESAVQRVLKKVAQSRQEINLMGSVKKGEKSKYVLDAMDYIRRHYRQPDLTVGTIAQDLGISEGHLSHIFKKETDCTLLTYLTRYRIHKSMELLKDCRVKVYQVAEQVGYRDIAYFSNTFKKLVGLSPSEYQSSGGRPKAREPEEKPWSD